MTEENGEIRESPKSWHRCRLGDILYVKNGYAFKSIDYSVTGIPLIRISDIQNGEVYTENCSRIPEEKANLEFVVESGDLLIAMSGATTGKVGVYNDKQRCLQNQRVGNFKIYSEKVINKKFRNYFIFSLRKKIEAAAHGGAQPNISASTLENFEILLPPFTEQERIVEKIEELFSDVDQGIESLKTAQKQLKVYRQAVLKWAFEGKLTEAWRRQNSSTLQTGEALLAQIKAERENRYQQQLAEWETAVKEWEAIGKVGKKPTKPQKAKELPPLTEAELVELPELPDGWCWASVEQLGYVQLGRQRSPQNRSKDFPTKYVRAANITENGFDLTDVLDMEFKPHEFKQYQLKSGDILLSEASGSPEHVGKPAVWCDQIPNCCFQNTVIRFRPIYLSSRYFLLVFKNLYSNGVFSNIASGVGINHLSANKFSAIPIPLAPLEEQERIVEEIESRLSICDQLEATIVENLQKAEALRQSILKQAFEGKLVPQDPNDEPAKKLLERIKAEREATQPKTSKQLKIKGL